jgi:hypothetical protein
LRREESNGKVEEMTTHADYTDSEWTTLQFGVLWTFSEVAGADNKIDEQEVAALAKELQEAGLYKEPLAREVLRSVGDDLQGVMSRYNADSRYMDLGLREVASILDKKADAEEARNFKMALVGIGVNVAKASGPRFGDKVSKEEKQRIALVVTSLGLPLEDVFETA